MLASDEFLDVQQAADLLALHCETVREFARAGRLPAFKAGRSWRFSSSRLRQWAEQQHTKLHQRVLVVDDEPAMRHVFRMILEHAGYQVLTVGSGEEAMATLDLLMPDIVLLDLMLPGASGVDVIRVLRSRKEDLPVVIVTGHPHGELMEQALVYSPLMVLAKPVESKNLLKAVQMGLHGVMPV